MNKRKRLISISGTKTNSVHLKFSTSLSMQEQSQDLSLLLLQGLDYLTLLSLWICWFCIISVFLSICFSSTFTFFKSLCKVFKRLLPFTSRLVFYLYLSVKVVKWWSLCPHAVTSNSSQLFKLSVIFPTSRFTFIYTLARHSSRHKNVLFLIPRHDRPKEEGKTD